MKRFLWLGLVLCLFLICLSCGDVFRPIILPNPPAFPDPRAAHSVVTINNNDGTANLGTVLQVDVSGDSELAVSNVGFSPVHAVQQTATQILVVNQAGGTGVSESLMKLSLFGGRFTATTISLPSGSTPNFVAVAPNSTTAYVSMPGTVPPSVAVVNTTSNFVAATIPVGSNPLSLAVTPDNNRLYVANNGDSTISGFNTVDRSPRNSPIALGAPPIWLIARSDNQRVYVLEQDGTVATLDTSSTAGPDSVIGTIPTGPGVSSMLYDRNLNRLYIPTSPGSGNPQLIVLDVSQSTPALLASVSLSASALPASGVAVAALPDGSRAYAAANGPAQTTTVGTISSVTGDGTTATYTFDPNSVTGPALQPGMSLTITGGGDGFDGTFIVESVSGSMFNAADPTNGQSSAARTATGTNFFPEVTVVNTSGNTVKTTINMPAIPAAGPYELPVCSTTRFRFSMAAGGDSSRVYLSTCDGGNVELIRTSDDTYLVNLMAPVSALPPVPPSSQPPPQSPVFMIAGP